MNMLTENEATYIKYLYRITNKVNGKMYIGQTINYKLRMNNHRSKGTCIITKAIHKYGIDNFKFEILYIVPIFAADMLERDLIEVYNTRVPNGYNIEYGGQTNKVANTTKRLLVVKKQIITIVDDNLLKIRLPDINMSCINKLLNEHAKLKVRSIKIALITVKTLNKLLTVKTLNKLIIKKLHLKKRSHIVEDSTKLKISNTLKNHKVPDDVRLKIANTLKTKYTSIELLEMRLRKAPASKGSTIYKGVSFIKELNKYKLVIVSKYMGLYDSAELAAIAYNKYVTELYPHISNKYLNSL